VADARASRTPAPEPHAPAGLLAVLFSRAFNRAARASTLRAARGRVRTAFVR